MTETFASGLITEGVLPTVEHAHEYLLTENATIIPQAASVMGYLAGGPQAPRHAVRGQDRGLRSLVVQRIRAVHAGCGARQCAAPGAVQRCRAGALRSEAKALPGGRRAPGASRATRHGVCVGVAQWIKLELDAQTTYENRPTPQADYNGHWTHIVHRFPKPVTVAPGRYRARAVPARPHADRHRSAGLT